MIQVATPGPSLNWMNPSWMEPVIAIELDYPRVSDC